LSRLEGKGKQSDDEAHPKTKLARKLPSRAPVTRTGLRESGKDIDKFLVDEGVDVEEVLNRLTVQSEAEFDARPKRKQTTLVLPLELKERLVWAFYGKVKVSRWGCDG